MIKGPNHSEEADFSPALERLPRQAVPLWTQILLDVTSSLFWPDSAIRATAAASLLPSVSHVEDITLQQSGSAQRALITAWLRLQ